MSACKLVSTATTLLLVASALCPTAHADVTIYTSQADFLNAIASGYYFNDFSSLPPSTFYPSTLSFSGNGYSYDVSAADNGGLYSGNGTNSWIGANDQVTSSMLTVTGGTVTALGLTPFSTDVGNNLDNGSITVTLNTGDTETFPTSDLSTFVGFTDSDPITSVTVTASPFSFSTLTNVYVGAAAVPDPGACALLAGFGVAGAAFLRRRLAR